MSAYIGLAPFLNASNVAMARKAAPRFIITGNSIAHGDVIARFGPPRAEHCAMPVRGSELRVLDYSDSDKAKDQLRSQAIKSY